MPRLSISLLVSMITATTTVAGADSFGGWDYTPPPGYAIELHPDHVGLTNVSGSTFCSIAIFEARALDRTVAAEAAFEWQNVVTHAFKATVHRRATMRTKHGIEVATTTATLTDAGGRRYAATHYVVTPPGMIGSVLVISGTAATLAACNRAAAPVVRSLDIDWTSPRFTDPEARVDTPQGRWAVVGATSREYTFSPDGTYRFHSEATATGTVRVIHETGSYSVRGNRLTLAPLAGTTALVAGGVAKQTSLKLEKASYTWSKRYVPETNEWRLVLSPSKATARDGKLPADASYQYSDLAKPAWKFASQPGV